MSPEEYSIYIKKFGPVFYGKMKFERRLIYYKNVDNTKYIHCTQKQPMFITPGRQFLMITYANSTNYKLLSQQGYLSYMHDNLIILPQLKRKRWYHKIWGNLTQK